MENRYSAFIFDMDGTLVDNMSFHFEAWIEYLTELGTNPDPRTFMELTAGKINPEIFRMFLGADLTDDQITFHAAKKEDRYRRLYLPHMRPMPGLVKFLEQARAAGMLLGVATAANWENVEFVLQGIGLRDAFDTIVTADDITRGKPDPEIFLIAAQRLGVPPARCLVFEDSLMGIEAAHRAGMDSVALTTSITAQKVTNLTGVKLSAGDYSALSPAALAV